VGVRPCKDDSPSPPACAEIDLLFKLLGHRQPWAMEIQRSLAPKVEKGYYLARESVRPGRCLVVYGGDERFPLGDGVETVSLGELLPALCRRGPARGRRSAPSWPGLHGN
jgi:hypothetical protein